jgi:hypothetical protein
MPTLPCLNESHQKKTNSNFTIPAHALSVVHIVQYILKADHESSKAIHHAFISHALRGTNYSIHPRSRSQISKAVVSIARSPWYTLFDTFPKPITGPQSCRLDVVSMSSRCRLERAYGLSGTRFSINPQSRSQVPKAGMSSERKLSVVRTAQHVLSTDGRTSKAIHPDVVSSARSQWYTWLNMCLEPMVGPQRNLHDVISSSRSLNGEHC